MPLISVILRIMKRLPSPFGLAAWLQRGLRRIFSFGNIIKTVVVLAVLLVAVPFAYRAVTGKSIIIGQGGHIWIPIDEKSLLISKAVSVALHNPIPQAVAGEIVWQELQPGFDVGELPVLVGGEEIDSIFLTRIDPAHFRFVVETEPSGDRAIGKWMRSTGAALVVNGSYYGSGGLPSTPVISNGKAMGPNDYDATHGAFVAADGMASIKDLSEQNWQTAFEGAQNAMVSFPLLLNREGEIGVRSESNWLANRSFLAEDAQGNILVGTTRDSFFSLDRLAAFLKASPLDLAIVLNLDGGPIACQGVRLAGFKREVCGRYEVQIEDGQAKMLPPLWMVRDSPMPIVLAAYPNDDQ